MYEHSIVYEYIHEPPNKPSHRENNSATMNTRPERHARPRLSYVGAATRPAGPWPSCCPPTLLSKGLNPSSSVGTPNDFSFDSYVRIRSLCACRTKTRRQESSVGDNTERYKSTGRPSLLAGVVVVATPCAPLKRLQDFWVDA